MTRSALTAALIVLALTAAGARQDAPDASASAVTKAWAILTQCDRSFIRQCVTH
jgi:hypothetical protein